MSYSGLGSGLRFTRGMLLAKQAQRLKQRRAAKIAALKALHKPRVIADPPYSARPHLMVPKTNYAGLGNLGSWFSKAKKKVQHIAKPIQKAIGKVVPKKVTNMALAVVAPIMAAPALLNKDFRKDSAPVYAAYGVAAGAAGAVVGIPAAGKLTEQIIPVATSQFISSSGGGGGSALDVDSGADAFAAPPEEGGEPEIPAAPSGIPTSVKLAGGVAVVGVIAYMLLNKRR